MKALQLKDGLHWIGVLDTELRVFDIIMETEFGTTYNSYVLKGSEKTVVFETCKVKFFDEYLEKLQEVVKIADIDYIVMNHTEPDHAGSIAKLIALNPGIRVVATPTAIGFLKNIINQDFYSIAVRENDTLDLGDKTLHFMALPNLHWPDTMYTYVEEDALLFPCDSFGSHYCLADVLLSKLPAEENEGYLRAFKYYFDNIIGPFKPYMLKALERIEELPISMICPGHGPVVDTRIDEIKNTYKEWCTVVNPNLKKTVIIPYVSAYGYTGQLAEEIASGIRDSGPVDVRTYDMVVSDVATVLGEIGYADGILFGTPTILAEALKPIWDLTTSMYSVIHSGKLASAFGSYAWSGEGVPHIMERLKQLRLRVVDGYRVRLKPSDNELIEAYEYGYNFGCILQDKENDKLKKKKKGKSLMKCLVCGEIFPEGTESCPVCGVGPENFIPVEEDDISDKKNTQERFVILGNGAAAINAAMAIRDRNETATVMMITKDAELSYNRPMLTKNMLANNTPEQIAVKDAEWYKENKIETLLGKEIAKLDAEEKAIYLADGQVIPFDKCIYALGAESFIPPIPGVQKPEVVAIRRISDTAKVREFLHDGAKEAIVIGGGVLGLEAAWELSKAKCHVTVLEMGAKLMARQLDDGANDMMLQLLAENNIDIKFNVKIDSILGDEHVTGVRLEDGDIPADFIIVSAGVKPNVAIAQEAGITLNRAIVVNAKMETNLPNVYACGDCAEFEGINYSLWTEALEMGRIAGANAAGDSLAYETILAALTFHGLNSSVYSVGDNGKNPQLKYKTVEFKDMAKKTYEKYYFVNNRLSGVILMGDIRKLVQVTEAIQQPALFQDMFS